MAGPSPKSCSECRKAKRKCSGDDPSCNRCQKLGRQCEYPSTSKTRHGISLPLPNSSSSVDQGDNFRSQAVPGADVASQSDNGCALYFLDADFFVRKGFSITAASKIDLPTNLLNSVYEIIRTTSFDLDFYFQSIHTFFPISM